MDRIVLIALFVVSSAVFSTLYPGFLAFQAAATIKNGETKAVEVRYRSFSGTAGQVAVPGLDFIGPTVRAAFFYDPDAKRTIVIPQTQIVSIEVPD